MQAEVTNAFVYGVREFLKRRYPYTPKYAPNYEEEKALKNGIAKWHFPLLVLMLVIITALTLVYAYLLHELYEYTFHALLPGEKLYLYSWQVFCFPCVFLAFGTFTFPHERIKQLLMEEKYEAYTDYYYTQQQYDGQKVSFAALRLFGCIFLLAVVPVCTSFISTDGTNLTIKQFYQISPRVFPINSIQKIAYDTAFLTENNKINTPGHYILFLKNGCNINTQHWAFDNDSCIVPIMNHLHQAGIALDTDGVSRVQGSWFSLMQKAE